MNIKKADLIVFAGQSNMSGRGAKEEAVKCPAGAGFEYKPVSRPDTLVPIEEPFGLNEEREDGLYDRLYSERSGSMVSAAVAEYYRRTGRQVVALAASMGGTSTRQWLEDGLLTDALDRLKQTFAFLDSQGIAVERKYLVWCQGETDADFKVPAEEYIARTENILGQFVEHGIEKCFLVQIGHYNYVDCPEARDGMTGEELDRCYGVIRNAQFQICLDKGDVVLAASFEPYLHEMKDAFHYRQSAYNEVGLHVGRKMARAL